MLQPNISNWKAYITLHSCVICALIQGLEITLYFYTDHIHNYMFVKLHIQMKQILYTYSMVLPEP